MSADIVPEDRLTQKELAVLFAAYSLLDSRMNMHVPKESIRKKLGPRAQWKLKKPLKSLVAQRLLRSSPTAGCVTYYPTEKGIRVARERFPTLFPI